MNRLEQFEQLEKTRKLWKESEWRLQFLRTETGQEPKEIDDQDILQWYQQIQERTHFMTN
jgi:hypothetical protein